MALFAGLMSGTSLDGIDGVLVSTAGPHRLLAHVHQPFEPALRTELLALNRPGGLDELHRSAVAARSVALAYVDVVQALLTSAGIGPKEVRAIGAHGQTVRHRPADCGYTVQLLQAALLAERTGIDVVADFRSRDVAAGGQGAPLVPAFHAAMFSRPGVDVAVLNLGGIANLSLLAADGHVRGFDTGPANALLDHWIQRHRGLAFDRDGEWAAAGRPHPALLAALLDEPYFSRRPPKSTGRDLFEPGWLQSRLDQVPGVSAQDVQATLAELTAQTCAGALLREAPETQVLRVCGGGARNLDLMGRLAALLPAVDIASSEAEGIAPEHVEAWAFAWMAQAFVDGTPANLPAVTGATGLRRLGALYPA